MSTNRHSWRKLKAAAGRVPIARALYIGSLRRQVREHRKSAIVYVDGFNLYRNALQKHPEVKWLDLVRLCEIVMPGFTISKVRFFTAEIHALKGTDPRSPSRQQAYLRALDTNDRLVIHRGRFRAAKRTMDALPIEVGPDGRRKQVKVRKIEEKQSDVNLATWMIRDAMLNEADVYVLLSSDSDFAGLLNVMIGDLEKSVGVISPIDSLAGELRQAGPRYVRRIRYGALQRSQLPETVKAGRSTLRRPDAWAKSWGPDKIGAPQPVAEASGDT